jgi:hypothetical protein
MERKYSIVWKTRRKYDKQDGQKKISYKNKEVRKKKYGVRERWESSELLETSKNIKQKIKARPSDQVGERINRQG